jgi:hypothetical protein
VAGHEFRHALEFLFKAGILCVTADCDDQRTEEPLTTEAAHALVPLWTQFKQTCADVASLSRFDVVVAKIDDWEATMRSGLEVGRGKKHRVGMILPAIGRSRQGGGNSGDDDLIAEEVDELYTAAIGAMNIGVAWSGLIGLHSPQARYMYLRENLHPWPSLGLNGR